ncbi:RSP_7527 family protein [Marinomonas sp.]
MNNDLKYDEFGNLDTDYYVEQAYAMRNTYYAEAIKSAASRAKAFFSNLANIRFTQTPVHSK